MAAKHDQEQNQQYPDTNQSHAPPICHNPLDSASEYFRAKDSISDSSQGTITIDDSAVV